MKECLLMNKEQLIQKALMLNSTNEAFFLSKKISNSDIEELNYLVKVLNHAIDLIFNEDRRWALVFKIQFINEAIQFKKGILKI